MDVSSNKNPSGSIARRVSRRCRTAARDCGDPRGNDRRSRLETVAGKEIAPPRLDSVITTSNRLPLLRPHRGFKPLRQNAFLCVESQKSFRTSGLDPQKCN
jgi:hypothetical protein